MPSDDRACASSTRSPLDQGPQISYPGGIVTASGQPVKARALLSWLRGDTAMGIFKAAGFGAPAVVAR